MELEFWVLVDSEDEVRLSVSESVMSEVSVEVEELSVDVVVLSDVDCRFD